MSSLYMVLMFIVPNHHAGVPFNAPHVGQLIHHVELLDEAKKKRLIEYYTSAGLLECDGKKFDIGKFPELYRALGRDILPDCRGIKSERDRS